MEKRKYKATHIDMADKATRWANGIGGMQGAEITWASGAKMWRSHHRGLTDWFETLDEAITHLLEVESVWKRGRWQDKADEIERERAEKTNGLPF